MSSLLSFPVGQFGVPRTPSKELTLSLIRVWELFTPATRQVGLFSASKRPIVLKVYQQYQLLSSGIFWPDVGHPTAMDFLGKSTCANPGAMSLKQYNAVLHPINCLNVC
jgi:hypothetical protein